MERCLALPLLVLSVPKKGVDELEKLILVGISILLIMAIFMQYPVQIVNHNNISAMQVIVDRAKEQAKQDGCFTAGNIANIKKELSEKFGVAEGEIIVNVSSGIKYRTNEFSEEGVIEYKIGVPIKKIIAANRFWGVSDNENKTTYYIEGKIASERLEP